MFDFLKKWLSGSNDAEIKRLRKIVDAINALEPKMKSLSDDGLRALTAELQSRARGGESLDDILPEAFALVREGAFRAIVKG